MKNFLVIPFLFCFASLIGQQTITVSGTVIEGDSNMPIPGANIIEEGTSNGVQTDFEGEFTIEVPSDARLVISYLGYASRTVEVNGRTDLGIILQPETSELEEVVIVGYGSQKKVNLTGSVATVNGDDLTKRPVTSAGSMLQGQAPGLRIVQNSGEPGNEGLSVRVRGQGTFSGAGSNPLVLIDGVEGSLNDINPIDIQDVSVLKDAASASIYGSRAANGVILITTKTGAGTPFNVRYDVNYAIHTPSRMFDLITDSAEYMELWNEAKTNQGITDGLYPASEIEAYRNATDRIAYPNADWLDVMFDPALVQNHNLSVSGSKGGTNYNFSLGYVDQEGVMKGFDYKRYNVRLNLGSEVHDNIKIGANMSFKKGDRTAPRQGSHDQFLSTLSQAPTYLPKLPDGRYTFRAYDFELNNKNPLAIVENGAFRHTVDYNANLQGWVDINFLPGLNWYTKAAIVGDFSKWDDWRPKVAQYDYRTGEYARDLDVGGSGLAVQDDQNIYTNLYSYLNFEKEFDSGHNLMAQVGYSQEENESKYLYGYRRDFASNYLTELDAGGPAVQNASGSTYEWALQSFFGRLGYNYKERYLLEFNMRYDGSSRMHSEKRWGAFPSISAGWRISQEPFVQDANMDWLRDFKIRASHGELGNQNIGNYPYQSMLTLTGNYPFNNSDLSTGVAQTTLANPFIFWETTTLTDVGLDMTVFDGLSLTFDWYRKTTSDILRASQVTGIVGLGAPTINDGKMENTGVEINVQYRNWVESGYLEGLSYQAGFYIDHFKNELVKFGEREIGGMTIREEGRPWDTFYMLESIGVFQTQEEIDAAPRQFNDNTQPGDLIYRDVNGDGVIDNDDRTYIDGQYPDFEYSFNFSANWKNFDISFLFQGVQGRKIFVNNWGAIPFVQGSPPTTDWRNRWTPENPSLTMPKLYFGFNAPAKFSRNSTYFLQDASYLRLKNLNIGYNLPEAAISPIGISNFRIYVSGDNLLTFTDYPGLDPERGGSGSFVNYPQNTIYSLGLNIQF